MAFNPIHFNDFIKKLTSYTTSSTVENQYLNTVQIDNLKKYLTNLEALNPTVLLVGEAPGYNGCTLSGIAFTSEYIINTRKPMGVLNSCTTSGSQKEASATIVWDKLDERLAKGKLTTPPIIWNIFPFHPHDVGKLKSNRTPNKAELTTGMTFLFDLIALFPTIQDIYAIGKKAEETIKSLPRYASDLRHPSFGGKDKFNNGIDLIYP